MLAADVDAAGTAGVQRTVGADLDFHRRIGRDEDIRCTDTDQTDRDVIGRTDRTDAPGPFVRRIAGVVIVRVAVVVIVDIVFLGEELVAGVVQQRG